MNVTCGSCQTVFRVDPAKVPAAGVRARCSVCAGVFWVRASAEGPPAPAIEPGADAASLRAKERQPPVAAPPLVPSPPPPAPVHDPLPEVKRTPPPPDPVPPRAEPVRPEPARAKPAPDPRRVGPPPVVAPVAGGAQPASLGGGPPRPGVSGPLGPARPAVATAPPAAPGAQGVRGVAPTPPPPAVSTPAPAPPAAPRAAGPPLSPPPEPVLPPRSAPASAGPGPARAPAPAADRKRRANPFLSQDPEARARRLARALISDMVVYHPAKRREGLDSGNLKALFEEEIRKSWEEYVDQVGSSVAESTPHFHEALNEILADGKPLFP